MTTDAESPVHSSSSELVRRLVHAEFHRTPGYNAPTGSSAQWEAAHTG